MAPTARSLLVVWLALGACSGHGAEPSDPNGGSAGVAGRGIGGQHLGGAGNAGRAGAGAAPSLSGAGGSGGAGAAGASAGLGAGAAGAAGGASVSARVSLVALSGSGVSGTALFSEVGDHLQLELTLAGCAAGAHALHLHANASCDDDGNAAGGHWSPQGEVMPDVTCAADGSAELLFDAAPGAWTLGAPTSSDVLGHALMLHAGPAPAPGARVACGISAKAP